MHKVWILFLEERHAFVLLDTCTFTPWGSILCLSHRRGSGTQWLADSKDERAKCYLLSMPPKVTNSCPDIFNQGLRGSGSWSHQVSWRSYACEKRVLKGNNELIEQSGLYCKTFARENMKIIDEKWKGRIWFQMPADSDHLKWKRKSQIFQLRPALFQHYNSRPWQQTLPFHSQSKFALWSKGNFWGSIQILSSLSTI